MTIEIFGFLYVKAKSFEILLEVGNNGVRFAKRSRGVYRVVILVKLSVIWFPKTVEELIKGENLREFC